MATPSIRGYANLTRIGRGGFSVVYRGTQVSLDRPVAIKVLLADLEDEDQVRRFTSECRVLGRLGNHPNVVDVHEAGVTEDGQPFIVMKFYSRGSLADRLKASGPLGPAEVIEIGIKMSGALSAAHAIGVIHRDVKPDNVLVDDNGEPVLTDFGVAAVADAAGRYTSSVAFSRAHVAPEVLDRNEFGVSSDVYGLGSTLFTLLTGRAAFAADTEARQYLAIMNNAVPALDGPGVPAGLSAVIATAMAKRPADRFLTAQEFADALAAVRADFDAPAPAPAASPAGEVEVEDAPTVRRPAVPPPTTSPAPVVAVMPDLIPERGRLDGHDPAPEMKPGQDPEGESAPHDRSGSQTPPISEPLAQPASTVGSEIGAVSARMADTETDASGRKRRSRVVPAVMVAVVIVICVGVAMLLTQVFLSRSCAAGGDCQVGDEGPGGGVVFFDAGSPQFWGQYLEAAPQDLISPGGSGLLVWCPRPIDMPTAALTRLEEIGQGFENTELLLIRCPDSEVAAATESYRGRTGRGGWFVPSSAELDALFSEFAVVPGLDGVYWSSSRRGPAFDMYHQDSSTGIQGYSRMDAELRVRLVRAF